MMHPVLFRLLSSYSFGANVGFGVWNDKGQAIGGVGGAINDATAGRNGVGL